MLITHPPLFTLISLRLAHVHAPQLLPNPVVGGETYIRKGMTLMRH